MSQDQYTPNQSAGSPNQPGYDWFGGDTAAPMPTVGNQPPAGNEGQPPVWDIPSSPRTTDRNAGAGMALSVLLLAALGVVLVIVLTFFNRDPVDQALKVGSKPTPTPVISGPVQTPTALPPISSDDATNVVTQFYTSIGGAQFQTAYNLLGSDFRNQKSLDQFAKDWNGTLQVAVDPATVKVTSNTDGSANVALVYAQTLQKDKAVVTQTYQANLSVANQNGQPVITKIGTTLIPATPTPQPSPTPAPTATTTSTTPTPSATPAGTTTPAPTPSPTPKK